MHIKRTGWNKLVLAGGVATVLSPAILRASFPDQVDALPYDHISQRNVFDLHDPPIQTQPPTNPPALPNIFLTGITTLHDTKQAYLVVQSPAAAGKPAGPDRYFTLREGQREAMLEVIAIDPKAKTVTLNNSGVLATITFPTNQIAFSGRLDMNITSKPALTAANPAPPMRPHGQFPPSGTSMLQPPLDPEQQVVLMELQREATKSQTAAGQMPPLPPTALSEIIQQEQQQSQATGSAPASQPPNFPGQHNSIR